MVTVLAKKVKELSIGRAVSQSRREQASFEALIESCWDALWRYAYRLTGNAHDAEDLLSETLIEGFRGFRQFRGETTFPRWMYRIMTHTHIDMGRSAKTRRVESLDALREENELSEPADSSGDPERLVVEPMVSEPVQQALNALSDEFRAVVVLADIDRIDYADVSRILQIPVGTVRSRLHRARALLRASLSRHVSDWE